MATVAELKDALVNAHAAGDTAAARRLADAIVSAQQVAQPAAPASPELPSWVPDIFRRAYGQGPMTLPQDQPAELPAGASAATVTGANLPHSARQALAALQGPTFGFGDEIAGGVVGGAKTLANGRPFAQNYADVRDAYRAAVDRQLKDEPGSTATDQFIASLPVGGPIARLFGSAPTLGRQVLSAGGTGAVSGAINGLGSSSATDLGGQAEDALAGGGIGLAMGGFGVPITRALGAATGNLVSRFSDSAASHYAQQKVAEAFARDAAPGVSDALGQASRRLGKLGGEARVVDTGGQSGQSVKALLDTVTTLPGRSKSAAESAIRERQASRGGRMIGAAEDAFGVNGVRMAPQMDDWVQQQAAQAGPLYRQLHQMDVPASQDLSSIVAAAQANGYDKIAQRIAINSRAPFTLPEDAAALNGTYSMRDLDYLKQGLDTAIAKMRDNMTGKLTPEGHSADQLRRQLIAQLDRDTHGAYAVARNAYAGPAQLMDAANAGRRILSSDDAAIRAMVAGFGSSERDAFSLGAFEALRSKAGAQSGQTELMNLWRQDNLRDKLKAIFGDERSYREFASRVAAEGRMKSLESVGRGSQTASRLYAAGDLDTSALGAAGDLAGSAAASNPLGVMSAGSKLWNKVSTPEPVRDVMGQILLSRGPQAQQDLLALQASMRQVNEARRRRTLGLGLGAGSQSGNLLGLIN